MNTQNLINLISLENLDGLTEEQLMHLLAQAYGALAELEAHPIEHIKMMAVIRRIEMRLADIKAQPSLLPHPCFTP